MRNSTCGAEFLREPSETDASTRLAGDSAAMKELRRQIAEVASTRSTVLIRGETGTGKGLVAALLHDRTPRPRGPFIHVDCTSVAPTLVESELFGHERGAFTGADKRRTGKFELARAGTIFLDEIGDMDPALQVKLLRVLQDRRYERVGGSTSLSMNARVIAATHRDLEQSIAERGFREDLYYRLRVLELWVPPLRDRRDDVRPLAEHFLARLAERMNSGSIARAPSDDFFERLREHCWPGNVRELQNLLERAVVMSRDSPLDAALVGRLLRPARYALSDRDAFGAHTDATAIVRDGLEPSAIARALRNNAWNISETARQLRIPRSTLRYRIARFGLARDG
jgi:DNA-binding NtrC family response regulator